MKMYDIDGGGPDSLMAVRGDENPDEVFYVFTERNDGNRALRIAYGRLAGQNLIAYFLEQEDETPIRIETINAD